MACTWRVGTRACMREKKGALSTVSANRCSLLSLSLFLLFPLSRGFSRPDQSSSLRCIPCTILLNWQETEGDGGEAREGNVARSEERSDDNLCPLPLLPAILSSSSMNQLQQTPCSSRRAERMAFSSARLVGTRINPRLLFRD